MSKGTFAAVTIVVTMATIVLAAVIFMQLPQGQGLAQAVGRLGRPIGLAMTAVLAFAMGWALLSYTRTANQELADRVAADAMQKDALASRAKSDDTVRIIITASIYFLLGLAVASLLWVLPLVGPAPVNGDGVSYTQNSVLGIVASEL